MLPPTVEIAAARRIGRPPQAVRRERRREVVRDDAGLHDRRLVLHVDREHPVHAAQVEHDRPGGADRAAGEPGAGPARDDGHAVRGGQPERRPHVIDSGGAHDGERRLRRRPAAAVGADPVQLGGVRAQRGPDGRGELVEERHADQPRDARGGGRRVPHGRCRRRSAGRTETRPSPSGSTGTGTELLQELRVVQTGTQLLTGFLLTVAFQPTFHGRSRTGRRRSTSWSSRSRSSRRSSRYARRAASGAVPPAGDGRARRVGRPDAADRARLHRRRDRRRRRARVQRGRRSAPGRSPPARSAPSLVGGAVARAARAPPAAAPHAPHGGPDRSSARPAPDPAADGQATAVHEVAVGPVDAGRPRAARRRRRDRNRAHAAPSGRGTPRRRPPPPGSSRRCRASPARPSARRRRACPPRRSGGRRARAAPAATIATLVRA